MAESLSFAPSAFTTAGRRALLVGRAAEMRELEQKLLHTATEAKTFTVSVVGAHGVGKSRLVRDFLQNAREHDPPARVFRGSARDRKAAYGVFARLLRARFGIVEGMDAEAAKAQVRAQVSAVLDDRKVGDVCFFLGRLLDLEFVDSPLIQAIKGDAEQSRAMLRAVLKRFLEADAVPPRSGTGSIPPRGTLVLVFDDLQDADDESLDLIEFLVDSLAAPILVVCVARPELHARRDRWRSRGGARHVSIELAPLSETDAAAVMHDLLTPCAEDEAIEDLIDAACTLAGGNPALLEQMVRIFFDMGVLEVKDEFAEEDAWVVHADKLASVRLPLTIEDAIAARIAALAPDERIWLERAAAMGGVFWRGGLVAIARAELKAPETWIAGASADISKTIAILTELVERDYVLELPDSTFAGDVEYVFKHNLEREALVKLTSQEAAKRYHHAIADWLSFQSNVRANEEYLGILARHRELAGRNVQAAATYISAGDVARDHYANAKALEHYERGLALLRAGAEADADTHLRALHHHGDVLQILGRNDEALESFREMLARAWALDVRAKGGAAHSRIGRLFRETGRLEEAGMHLDAALALFEDAKDERGIASTTDDIGKLHWLRGDYAKALEHTQRALTMRRKFGDRRSIALSLNNLGLVYQDSGQFKLALDAFEQALRIRREIGDLAGVLLTLNNLGTVAQDQRDDTRALELYQEAYEVAKETGDRNRIALVHTNIGETYNRLGDPVQAVKHLKEAEEIAEELGAKLCLAEAVRGLGKAYLAQREFTKAREYISRAVDIFREIGSRVQLGVALRSLGEVMAACSVGGEEAISARGHLLQSIWIFEEIGNDVELARSCRVYARLLRTTVDFSSDPGAADEAAAFEKRSEDIFAKLKISAFGIDAEAFFKPNS